MTAVVWFRDDLRLSGHAALAAAGRAVPAFVLDAGASGLGGAAKWWLHHALAALSADIAARGGRLVLARGAAGAALAEIAAAVGADTVHAHAARIPAECAVQEEARRVLAARGVRLVLHPGALLHDPATLRSGAGTPYAVFTPFWRAFAAREEAWLSAPAEAEPTFAPSPEGLALGDLALLPGHSWADKLAAHWRVGEVEAERRLEDFVAEGLAGYARDRDRPDLSGVSRLSPYLRWGHLSPHRVWRRVRAAMDADPAAQPGGWAFLRQLAWREFAHHVLAAHPDMARKNLKPAFDAFPWVTDAAAFARWRRGETGYPLVDAAMRELWATGWMHNRGRMVAASFLVKHLRCDWRAGLAWFDDTLVDADPALDPFGWQWVAGSGADAAPYFRIFNPVLQAQKFDPVGAYRARWGAAAEVPPMVEHGAARAAALAAYREIAKDSHS